ncbi:CarD family transcriptional regulator [Arthrobacter sulfonylureivorans]|uniref:CarD family transcriptional regulator n=1 Tax=Arthrobacter sulfonylureivorans TaxID=2486855 RepID=UPI0039E28EFE
MQFAEGQSLVHPHHGPAVVRGIRTRLSRQHAECRYVMLEIKDSNLTVGVPVENAEEIGLRTVFDEVQMQALFEVLRAPSREEDPQWSRRFKDNQERLRTGDIFVIAGLVRDLSRRLQSKGSMSHAEKDMLQYAKKPLATEIALSKGIGLQEAEEILDAEVALPVPAAEQLVRA